MKNVRDAGFSRKRGRNAGSEPPPPDPLLRLTIRDSVPESYQGRPQLLETFKPS